MVFHRMSNGQLHPMEVVTGLSSGDQVQVLSGLKEGQVVVASATFLIDAESNLGAAMAGMAGMAGMDMAEEDTGAEEIDHSEHQMGEMAPDTAEVEVDHSQMDHSSHDMPGMLPDTTVQPDTGGAMDHSMHLPDTTTRPDTSRSSTKGVGGQSRGTGGS